MIKQTIHNRYIAILVNILLVYLMYAACRLIFLLYNLNLYPDINLSTILHMLRFGVVFDNPAILYSNSLVILMLLIPVWGRAAKAYFATAKWIYIVTNSLCLASNLMDAVYFPFTGKRTTCSVFLEFQNEGTSAMAKIMWEQFLANWPLVLLFAFMVWLLWRGFVKPNPDRMRPHTALKIVGNVVIFIVVAVLAWGLSRGGFTGATRPITISNAYQYAAEPNEAAVILNTPFSLLRTINKKTLPAVSYMPSDKAFSIFKPLHTPPSDTDSLCHWGVGKGMNVVVFILESFGKQHIGYYNIDKDENGADGLKQSFTPFLDSLMHSEALTYRHSFANGRKSIDAMPSILCSIPQFIEPFVLTPGSLDNLTGIARELNEYDGYHTSFFHGAPNGSMGFEAFSKALRIQEYYGLNEYCADPRYNGNDDYDGTWGIWDEEFMQFFADKLSELPQPFFSSLFSVTSHTPFKLPKRYDGVFPTGPSPLQVCVAYTDNALRLFFEKAKQQDWFENTIFVFTADHMNQSVDPYYTSYRGIYAVPIIFYAPGLEWLKGYDTETVAEQIDIMPTLLALLGHEHPYIAFGNDLLAATEQDNKALYWLNEINGYVYYRDQMLYHYVDDNLVAAYDLENDPKQNENILDRVSAEIQAAVTQDIQAEIQVYVESINNNQLRYKGDTRQIYN